ncbi:nitric oxide synthase-interacting protein [Trichonephila clavipes]|nr:nitric oxide synthase-interacting protein [Trichonephila clavipes]
MSGHASSSTAGRKGCATYQYQMGKDSVKDFNCCRLTSQPCTNPVITSSGFLFEKGAVLDYIRLKQKHTAKRIKEQQARTKEEREKPPEPLCFINTGEMFTISIPWIPMSRKDRLEKIENSVPCPMSGNTLKVQDLIDVHFTRVNEPLPRFANQIRYMCAVTHEILENSVPMAVLRTSGNVVTMKCVEELIKKDMIDPTNGKLLNEEDIIPLQRGGKWLNPRASGMNM